jgi:hypothetical protein
VGKTCWGCREKELNEFIQEGKTIRSDSVPKRGTSIWGRHVVRPTLNGFGKKWSERRRRRFKQGPKDET